MKSRFNPTKFTVHRENAKVATEAEPCFDGDSAGVVRGIVEVFLRRSLELLQFREQAAAPEGFGDLLVGASVGGVGDTHAGGSP